MARPSRYSPEVRERAVRMVREHGAEHPSQWAAIASIASKLGCTAETLRPKNQLNAAALSTMANIAEGFMRGGSKEFAQFVRIAAGSNGEARALPHAAFGRKYLDKDEYERLVEMTQSIGRMLRVLEQRLRAPRPTVAPGTRTPPGA